MMRGNMNVKCRTVQLFVKTEGSFSYTWDCNVKTELSEMEFEFEDGMD